MNIYIYNIPYFHIWLYCIYCNYLDISCVFGSKGKNSSERCRPELECSLSGSAQFDKFYTNLPIGQMDFSNLKMVKSIV